MRLFKILLLGILLIVFNQLILFLMSFVFFYQDENHERMLQLGFLCAAIPMFLLTFLYAKLLKLTLIKDIYMSSIIWTFILCLSYLLIGIGNDNLKMIFCSPALYLMLLGAFLGPVIHKRL